MSLATLPPELFYEIATQLLSTERGEANTNALVLACQRFYAVLNPYLYRRNALQRHMSALFWTADLDRHKRRHKDEHKHDNVSNATTEKEPSRDASAASYYPILKRTAHLSLSSHPPSALKDGTTISTSIHKALHIAISSNNHTIASFLLSHPDLQIDPNRTLPIQDFYTADVEMDKILLSTSTSIPININIRNTKYRNRTPLSDAAAVGHAAVVRLLLDRPDIDPDAEDEDGRTALRYAVEGEHEAVVSLLLGRTTLPAKPWKLLITAMHRGYTGIVKLLLETPGIFFDLRREEGLKVLCRAFMTRYTEIVRPVLESASGGVKLGAGPFP
ncbi:hypothetical protein AJ79_07838 [Helicocarpus griseus UAMH5409]|uniref:Uncharacterized protein n=1 Tax=Helicocarpus griseus UAMH5409 TaxID=1447875 RepID=A0A2B7WYB8_9EURO|nr:hypothetical protein AJ79_07838 [Helicocarpus griseus UAMH5409]